MYAIVEIGGKQYKTEAGRYLYVPHMQGAKKDEVFEAKVLFYRPSEDSSPKIGSPYVKDCVCKGKVLSHVLGDKCMVFKKKRRKGYQVKRGHRQPYTKVLVESFEQKG